MARVASRILGALPVWIRGEPESIAGGAGLGGPSTSTGT